MRGKATPAAVLRHPSPVARAEFSSSCWLRLSAPTRSSCWGSGEPRRRASCEQPGSSAARRGRRRGARPGFTPPITPSAAATWAQMLSLKEMDEGLLGTLPQRRVSVNTSQPQVPGPRLSMCDQRLTRGARPELVLRSCTRSAVRVRCSRMLASIAPAGPPVWGGIKVSMGLGQLRHHQALGVLSMLQRSSTESKPSADGSSATELRSSDFKDPAASFHPTGIGLGFQDQKSTRNPQGGDGVAGETQGREQILPPHSGQVNTGQS